MKIYLNNHEKQILRHQDELFKLMQRICYNFFNEHAETIRNYNKNEITTKALKKQLKQQQYGKQMDIYNKGKLNPIYLDCTITQKGYEQCKKAKQIFENIQIDLVLVSPLRRTLITCDQIFKTHKSNPKIIVMPLLMEILHSATNIGSMTRQASEIYTKFDFSLLEEKYQSWYIQLLPLQIKQVLKKQIQRKKAKNSIDIAEVVLQYLKQYKKLEMIEDIVKRSNILREQIIKYNKIYKRIAIVGHSKIGKALMLNKKQYSKQYFKEQKFKNCQFCIMNFNTCQTVQSI